MAYGALNSRYVMPFTLQKLQTQGLTNINGFTVADTIPPWR